LNTNGPNIRNSKSLNDSLGSLNENGKTSLLVKPKGNVIELKYAQLPPKYMDLFDKANDYFKEIQIKFSRLQEEQQKRITPKFNESDNNKLDRNIYYLVREISNKKSKNVMK